MKCIDSKIFMGNHEIILEEIGTRKQMILEEIGIKMFFIDRKTILEEIGIKMLKRKPNYKTVSYIYNPLRKNLEAELRFSESSTFFIREMESIKNR